jgi:hypothetical protein
MPGSSTGWVLPQPAPGPYLRLFQDFGVTYTWLYGDNATDQMTMNDFEFGGTMNFPNFLWTGYPIHIRPVFVLSLWDGPDNLPAPADAFPSLPSRVYSTYLEASWDPKITPQFGGHLDGSIGIYSDFNAIDKDSVRLRGTALLVLNLTPTSTLKAGVEYLDRLDIKILPAFGVLWQPNPQTKFDIYFPRPKLSKYIWTVGNTDVWWFLAGEYGGGSWTVERPGVTGDRRMDINDFRVGGGLEWKQQGGMNAFIEVAYVWEREIFYASVPAAPPGLPKTQQLNDTFMLRGGIRY